MIPRRRLRIVLLVILLRDHADDAGCTPEESASYREMAVNLLDRWWPKVRYRCRHCRREAELVGDLCPECWRTEQDGSERRRAA